MTTTLTADWHTRAACAGADTAGWFPSKGDQALTAAAKRVCSGCPVKDQCLEAAMREEDGEWLRYGIRGGLTPIERKTLLARPRRDTPRGTSQECHRGHRANRAPGKTCPACKAETDHLQRLAARALGMSTNSYLKTRGRARATAEAVLRDHEEQAA